MTDKTRIRFRDLAFTDGTPRKALLTACVVGTVLTIINHGDNIMSGIYPPPWKVLLTYCVPFCVTTWGAFLGKRAAIIKQQHTDVLYGSTRSQRHAIGVSRSLNAVTRPATAVARINRNANR